MDEIKHKFRDFLDKRKVNMDGFWSRMYLCNQWHLVKSQWAMQFTFSNLTNFLFACFFLCRRIAIQKSRQWDLLIIIVKNHQLRQENHWLSKNILMNEEYRNDLEALWMTHFCLIFITKMMMWMEIRVVQLYCQIRKYLIQRIQFTSKKMLI